jgi:hypothetical protein
LSAYVSDPITTGAIKYREVVILAPSDNGPSLETFDHGAGTLVLCPGTTAKCSPRANARIDGYAIESELYGRSLKILNDLALAAQSYFNAKYLSFPDHSTAVNWFRAPYSIAGECTPGTADMPCLDGWTDVLDPTHNHPGATALALLWQPDQDPATVAECILAHACPFTNAWGGTIYLANGNDTLGAPLGLNSTSIPYRLALKTETPWNIPIEIFAVQTL